MIVPRQLPARRWLWLLPALPAAGLLIWLLARLVTGPLDYANKDFMSLWSGGRAVLLGLNPYDPAVWRSLRAANGSAWFPDPRAPFPLWTFLFTAPLALLPVPLAAAVWLTASGGALAAGSWILLRHGPGRSLAPFELALVALGVLLTPAVLLMFVPGQLTAFLFLALAGFVRHFSRRPVLAGACLAVMLLKPNAFIVAAPLLGLWLLWRRQGRVIAGGFVTGLVLWAATWLLEPGWLPAWLNVTEKTSVVTITPTLWGLAGVVGGQGWWLVGLILCALLTGLVAHFVFSRPELSPWSVLSLAVCLSLLVTPYTWVYEHTLLLLPWLLWLTRRRGQPGPLAGWAVLTLGLPWLIFMLAIARVNDAWGWLVPAITLAAIIWLERPAKEPVHEPEVASA